MSERTVTVNDKMQKRFRYVRTAAVGRNFDPEFKPELTPQQMLRLGVFCGKYMTDPGRSSPRAGSSAPSSRSRTRPLTQLFRRRRQPAAVGVANKGWIYPDDPRGWFQWYCRY